MKLFDGAWTAIVVSASVYLIIYLWMYGNKEIDNRKNKGHFEISSYIKRHIQPNDPKIPGIGVFFSRVKNTIPTSFAAHVRQNKFIHEKVFFLSVITENYPNVGSADHFECEEVSPNIYQITAKYGYKQIPDVSKIILWLCDKKIIEDTKNIWYFMSRRHFVLTSSGLVHFVWSRIFRLLSNVADSHTEFYCIPHSKVIDIGLHYKI
jgi:KUP system potassium uptake protein